MRTIKTYGVVGLMEWQTLVKVGKAHIRIEFAGGFPTKNGISPAKYRTDNPIIQHAIETSRYFSDGRITLLRIDEAEGAPKVRILSDNSAPAPAKSAPAPVAEEPAAEEGEAVVETQDPATAPAPVEEKEHIEGEEALTEVHVHVLQDAQKYLKEKFQIPTSKIRTKNDAGEVGKLNGVLFVWD